MPRFYFHIVAGSRTIVDPEGTELPTLGSAREEAFRDARELMSAAVLGGRDISQRSVQICDERGQVLLTVLFADTLTRCD
jgi:ATP-dependent protease HslVU (ClpYQ) peptidase subunit